MLSRLLLLKDQIMLFVIVTNLLRKQSVSATDASFGSPAGAGNSALLFFSDCRLMVS